MLRTRFLSSMAGNGAPMDSSRLWRGLSVGDRGIKQLGCNSRYQKFVPPPH